jgi:hypothetical protein
MTLSLTPFPGERVSLDVRITAAITRRSNVLTIGYTLRGDLAGLVIPAPAEQPFRKNNLWATTCFEFFVAAQDAPEYWEFNLSPAGHWNVYRFDDYRQGMREEPAFTALPFVVNRQPDALTIDLTVSMADLVPADERIQVACTAVIEHQDGALTYWALAHCGNEPDFHRRDSFIVEL